MGLGSLESLVAEVAGQLMPVDSVSHRGVTEIVLRELVEYFDVDAAFLRYNDHDIHASVLVAEWPPRPSVPDPDPLGVVFFGNAAPIFALTEKMREPAVVETEWTGSGYADTVGGSGGPEVSVVAVPLISGQITTGALGFVKAGDRRWGEDEIYTLTMIAAMLAQVQARVRAERELREAAYHDDLTGLASRRALLEYLDRRLQPGQPGPVAAVFIDLDRLKPLNDFLGHTAVDTFLCRTWSRGSEVTSSSSSSTAR